MTGEQNCRWCAFAAEVDAEAIGVIAHDAYWRCKEVGEPPSFGSEPVKLQQCWVAAAQAVAAALREHPLADAEFEHGNPAKSHDR